MHPVIIEPTYSILVGTRTTYQATGDVGTHNNTCISSLAYHGKQTPTNTPPISTYIHGRRYRVICMLYVRSLSITPNFGDKSEHTLARVSIHIEKYVSRAPVEQPRVSDPPNGVGVTSRAAYCMYYPCEVRSLILCMVVCQTKLDVYNRAQPFASGVPFRTGIMSKNFSELVPFNSLPLLFTLPPYSITPPPPPRAVL